MPRGNFYRPESFISPASEYGLLRSATPDRTVWLYARIPWSTALLDGANDRKRNDAAQQLMAFFDGLANQVTVAGMRYRYMLQSEYREFHLLTGSMPVRYSPPASMRDTDLGRYQAQYYRSQKVCKQFAVIGVPLKLVGDHSNNRKPGMLQRALTWYDRMCYSVANGCPMFEEYLPDAHNIERIMLNAGLEPFTIMDEQEREQLVAMMESWWVGRANSSALPILAENTHVHFFPDNATCAHAKNLYDNGVDCTEWNIDEEYPASICFARTADFNQSSITDPNNLWIARLMEVGRAGGANAVATSIRGKVEPAKVTADQIRRNSRTIDESIKERYEKGHEAPGDMTEIKERLDYKKAIYNTPDMPPSIIDLSVATCVAGNEQMAIDALGCIPNIEFVNLTTASEQLMAFKSMQACSNVRMTPYEIHWAATCVAGGGVSSFAKAGDRDGALVGLSEANRQPVYIGTTTVQDKDRRPILAIIGDTGSGKAVHISSTIPVPPQASFPHGKMAKISDLHEGDLVYGRDGKPYPLLKLHPIHTEDLYEVTLSDGQTIKASGNHQWIVSDFKDRNKFRKSKHLKSQQRKNMLSETYDELCRMSDALPAQSTMSVNELAEFVHPVTSRWWSGESNARTIAAALRFMGVESHQEQRDRAIADTKKPFKTRQNCRRYNMQEALRALIAHYDGVAQHAKRWNDLARERADVLRKHLEDNYPKGISITDIQKMLEDRSPSRSSIASVIKTLNPISEWDTEERIHSDRMRHDSVSVYNVREACRAIGQRMMLRYEGAFNETNSLGYCEQVVTTRDMLASGLKDSGNRAQWAIRAAMPVANPQADLPLDPWVLGAWLADGSIGTGIIASDNRNGDLQHVKSCLTSAGFSLGSINTPMVVNVKGLVSILRDMGILREKRIPEIYFSASIEQRLSLVQGLLDQDGTISSNGNIEFTQSADHLPIVRGMVRLLRSLGIVVHEPHLNKAGYTADGVRHEAQDRYRITFTTDLPVFSLQRKAALIPTTLRQTQQWLYVKDIRKISNAPHRCLTVGSPDHSFLIADYVPTHNTMAAFSLFLQWSKIDARDGKGKTPCIYINPKAGNDLEDATRSQGGTVIRLDSDVANGTFDPFNVIPNVEEAKEIAVLMMTNILGGDTKMESAMTAMLDYGVKHGARYVGRALLVAAQAVAKTIKAGNTAESIGLPSNTLEVFSTISMNLKANQGLRLIFGTDNDTKPLTISQNLTLINAGDRSLIPEGQDDSMTARIRQWTLRMVVMGAGTAVRGRDGMVGVDEAWVFMGKDKGASRTFEQWVRMARSQRFTPVIISQKVQEFIDADLTGGISRALLLALDNPEEANGTVSPAKSAERLLGIEDPNGRILQRMGADDTLDNGQPNPNSLKRLVSASTRKTVRGAVAYFKDGSKQPIPVEIVIPPALLKEISTTATDKIAREQRKNKEQ